MTESFIISKGTHRLDWLYKKFNQDGTSDDLSAEIEFIQVRGVALNNQ
jgi:hypothetical protein